MLDEYNDLVGWHKETGAPRRAELEELGLKDVDDELERDVAYFKQRRFVFLELARLKVRREGGRKNVGISKPR